MQFLNTFSFTSLLFTLFITIILNLSNNFLVFTFEKHFFVSNGDYSTVIV